MEGQGEADCRDAGREAEVEALEAGAQDQGVLRWAGEA